MDKSKPQRVKLNENETLEAKELLRQRHLKDGTVENLVRWHLQGSEKRTSSVSDETSTASLNEESKSRKDVFLWMTNHELMYCCPHLSTTETTIDYQASQVKPDEEHKDEQPAEASSDVEDLDDMRLDVIKLVHRARKQMLRLKKESIPKPLVSLSHTTKVLSTYAGLGSLAGVFRETGALDLILELLWTNDAETRRSAGRMLRALALHDAGSRAYVLLSLTQDQPDGHSTDHIQHYADFENRAMVMEMFAETASGEEAHAVALDSVQLPQVPGKALFTLMKCYLRVTSLMDVNTKNGNNPNQQRCSWMWLKQPQESSDVVRQFEVSLAISDLIFELNRVMDWNNKRNSAESDSVSVSVTTKSSNMSVSPPPTPTLFGAKLKEMVQSMAKSKSKTGTPDKLSQSEPPSVIKQHQTTRKPLFLQTIHDNSIDRKLLASLLKSQQPSSTLFKHPSEFSSKRQYTEYIQSKIKPGSCVRACQSYQDVNEGDEGVYRQHNQSNPPVQIFWHRLNRTFWVHWFHIQLIGDSETGGVSKRAPPEFNLNPENSKLWPLLSGMETRVRNLYGVDSNWDVESTKETAKVGISQLDWWIVLFYASKTSRDTKETIARHLSTTYPTFVHMCLIQPCMEDAVVVMTEILKDAAEKEKEIMRMSSICDTLMEVIEKRENEEKELHKKLKEEVSTISKKEPHVVENVDEKVEIVTSHPSGSSSKENVDKLQADTDSKDEGISVEERAKAVEMGLRIGLIVDEATEEKYLKMFLNEENYQFSARLWDSLTLKPDIENMLNISKLFPKSGRDTKIICLAILNILVGRAPVAILQKKRELDEIFGNILNAAEDTDSNVVGTYLQFVMASLRKGYPKSDSLIEPDNLEMTLATTGHLKCIFDIVSRFPDETTVVQDAIQCMAYIMGANMFAKNPMLNKDSVFMNMITAIITSIMATSQSETSLVDASANAFASDSDKNYSAVLHSFLTAVERLLTKDTESHKSDTSTDKCSGLSTKDQAAIYNALCVLCMIARKDQSKSLSKEREYVLSFLATGLKTAPMGSSIRRMMQRLKGLVRSDAFEMDDDGFETALFSSERTSQDDAINDDGLIIDQFTLPSIAHDTSEAFTVHMDNIKDASGDEIRSSTAVLMKEKVLPVLKNTTLISGDLGKCLANLRTFFGVLKTVVQDTGLIMFESYWSDLISVLQRILELCISSTNTKSLSIEIATDIVSVLKTLSELDRDFSVLLCGLEAKQTLTRLSEKHGTIDCANELRDVITSCERQCTLHNRLLAVVLGGCISTALHCIEDARRQHTPINVPLFDQLLDSLCKGADVEVKEDKCWDRLEVSSNPRQVSRLTDGNPKTYWESNGSSGAHWINVYIKKGVVVRKLTIVVAQEDSSYMPARIIVLGGNTPSDVLTQLSCVNVSQSDKEVVVLENARRHWPIVRVSIRRCQQGGIDTRIHGLTVVGPKPSFWPLLRRQLYIRTSLMYAVQVHSWVADAGNHSNDLSENGVMNHKILDVPNELVKMIKYEQDFANKFLPNAESALVLGQACRSAFSVPILTELLSKEKEVVGSKSLLEHMLDAYLKCNPTTLLDTKSAIFSSKLRRLLRLVVDLDQGGSTKSPSVSKKQDSEDDDFSFSKKRVQPLLKSSGHENAKLSQSASASSLHLSAMKKLANDDQSSSSTNENLCEISSYLPQIAQQLVDVIKSRFTSMLEEIVPEFHTKLNLQDCINISSKLLKMFKFLQKCIEDLFGAKSQFIIILATGIWRSMMSVGIKVKIMLAHIFNVLIHHYISAETKPDIYNMSLLLQLRTTYVQLRYFLPLVERTDFCHMFEHMYSLMLTKRLFYSMNYSLTLEHEICKHFQACFSDQMPVQLLQDATYSDALNSRFMSSFLEKCDAAFVKSIELNPAVCNDIWKKYQFICNDGLQVFVHRKSFLGSHTKINVESLRNLDSNCYSLLCDFEVFFRRERIDHSVCTFDQSKPSLNFTNAGYGVLHDIRNNIDLTVTTEQMMFLLRFNVSDNSCSIKNNGCLQLLIDKNVIYQVEPEVYKLRDVIAEDVFCLPNDEDIVTDLWNSSKILEQSNKRRLTKIDCSIVRVIKQEQQCVIDSLIEKAMKLCSSRRESESDSSDHLLFIPQANEVRARIEYLLNLGYLMHKEGASQVLIYNPDEGKQDSDSTSIADVCQTVTEEANDAENAHLPDKDDTLENNEFVKSFLSNAIVSKESTVVPITLFSSQEKKEEHSVPPSAAVAQLDMTKNEAQDSKFVSTFVSNAVSLQPLNKPDLTKISHDTSLSKQIHSNTPLDAESITLNFEDVNSSNTDADPLLFFGTALVSTTLTSENLLEEIRDKVRSCADALSENVDNAEALLLVFDWNIDKLIESYVNEQSKTLAFIGIRSANLQDFTNIRKPSSTEEECCLVCLNPSSTPPLCPCNHPCCVDCWKSYLSLKLEQDSACSTTCPVVGCRARPTSNMYRVIFEDDIESQQKYDSSLVRSFVESDRNYSWCHNPKGCDRIIRKSNDGREEGWCSACGWQTCFDCTYVEAHYPATCSHMSQWMDDGGYYEGMNEDAQSKHLARLISKRCPNCQANIEKNDGCLHMKCIKCGHDFCWRCLQPWRPTHRDYYNCSSKVSKQAHSNMKFVEYNKRCQFHNKAKHFAYGIRDRLLSTSILPNDLGKLKYSEYLCMKLVHCRRILAYCNVFGFYSVDSEKMSNIDLHSAALENKTLLLQQHLSETLLYCADIQHTVSSLKEGDMVKGRLLMNECDTSMRAIIEFSKQDMKIVFPSGKPETVVTESGTVLLQSNVGTGFEMQMALNARPAGMSDDDEDNIDDENLDDETTEHSHSDNDSEEESEDDITNMYPSDDDHEIPYDSDNGGMPGCDSDEDMLSDSDDDGWLDL